MGVPYRPDYLEAEPLNLTAEHFPLPCSLRELVQELYADPAAAAPGAQAMELQELLGYLRRTDNLAVTPLESVLAQAASAGDPALPTSYQIAVLHWIGAAFNDWEYHFPLEEPLAAEMRRLKPLVTALALTDPDFFVPGGHPLHQLIDNLQLAAVGWQSRLGRAGHFVEMQVSNTVNSALAWFQARDTDLAELCTQVTAGTERDRARSGRMAQRMIETEQGRIKTAAAKRQAAEMINAALGQYLAPPKIADFLKGAWYESAQLVLLKYGADSDQWQRMSAATSNLLDSLQSTEVEDPARLQLFFDTVTKLPKELRRWLLSLQHDSESVNEAIGVVEFVHLRILRKQPVELEHTLPIPVTRIEVAASTQEMLEPIHAGQWFKVNTGDGDSARVRLALRMNDEQRLLFANQAGIKVLEPGFAEFAALLEDGRVSLLDSGASFSRSLARATGIKSSEDLETFLNIGAGMREPLQPARQTPQARPTAQERAELQPPEPRPSPPTQERAQLQRPPEPQPLELLTLEQQQLELQAREQQRLEQAKMQRQREEMQRLHEQHQNEELERLQQQAHQLDDQGDLSGPAPVAIGTKMAAATTSELELPMGSWLGFHDGNTPLLAKLAVYDLETDSYIFVNRSGIKMRQLAKQELLSLMADGLADILETRSNFKEEIYRLKNKNED